MENENVENGLVQEEVAPAVVEKISLEDVRGEQAQVDFEEFMEKALKDPELVKNAMFYIKNNKDALEEFYGERIEIQESQPER